jgi:hypothetical protein
MLAEPYNENSPLELVVEAAQREKELVRQAQQGDHAGFRQPTLSWQKKSLRTYL